MEVDFVLLKTVSHLDRTLRPTQLFTLFFPLSVMLNLVYFTNIHGREVYGAWTDITVTELRRWLGVRFDMAGERPRSFAAYWETPHRGTPWMGKHRFIHINRALRFDNPNSPPSQDSPWEWKCNFVIDIVREACLTFAEPATYAGLDEISLKFHERSQHGLKMPEKPVKEGFKLWGLASTKSGHVHYFFLHSATFGVEGLKKDMKTDKIFLAPTTTTVPATLALLQKYWPKRYLMVQWVR